MAHYLAAADRAYRANDLAATVALVERGLAAGAAGESRGILHSIVAPARFYRAEMAECWDDSTAALALLPPGHPRRPSGVAWRACAAVHLGKRDDVDGELAELLASEPAERDLVDYGVALGHALLGHTAGANLDHARRLLARLVEVDARIGAASPLVRGHLAFGHAWYLSLFSADPITPWRLYQQAAACHGPLGYYLHIYSRVESANLAARLFPLAECLAPLREAVRSVQGMRAVELTYVHNLVANHLSDEGDAAERAEALSLARTAVGAARRRTRSSSIGVVALARAFLRTGDLDQAEAHARQAQTTIKAMGMRAYQAHADATLLEVLLAKADPSAAALADEALRAVETDWDRGLERAAVAGGRGEGAPGRGALPGRRRRSARGTRWPWPPAGVRGRRRPAAAIRLAPGARGASPPGARAGPTRAGRSGRGHRHRAVIAEDGVVRAIRDIWRRQLIWKMAPMAGAEVDDFDSPLRVPGLPLDDLARASSAAGSHPARTDRVDRTRRSAAAGQPSAGRGPDPAAPGRAARRAHHRRGAHHGCRRSPAVRRAGRDLASQRGRALRARG